ncbi:protein of unknown function [Paenibacillus alvei]|uniref:Uncharacterized protein n=1 Tax=Paenibacillus alvei TaxID=44250 RepID=A0A383R854_PAEAL|nr:protein of unknown function [Paenibacillus alvei]
MGCLFIGKMNGISCYQTMKGIEKCYDHQDVGSTFKKAINERPKEWLDGFIDYYTNQGFGKMQGLSGVEGTIHVLQERKNIELEIFNLLKMNKRKSIILNLILISVKKS